MKFSVIVPVRNDITGLGVALDGLKQQVCSPDEVLIVNAGDEPLTLPGTTKLPLRVAEAGPAFPGRARNTGARAAAHEWLVFVDGGTRPVPEWLDSFRLAAEQRPDAELIYGCFLPALRDDWDWAAAGVYLPPRPAQDAGSYPTTASLCVRRDFWDSIGGMPEDLRAGEDLLFFRSVAVRGAVAVVTPGARVIWDLPAGAWAHYNRLRLYSAATWPTELAQQWHWPLIRMYAAAMGVVLATPLVHSALPALLLALAAVRITRNYLRRRQGLPPPLTPSRALRIVAMTGLADAATLLGIWDSLTQRRSR
jgi:glycosyltransferase involved in cell wall biosynthesis